MIQRGDIVTVAAPGYYGKPRPAVVVQTNSLNEAGIGSVIVCLMTSTLRSAPLFRINVEPSAENGLQRPSQIMVEKLQTVRRERVGPKIGALDAGQLLRLNRTLAFVIGLG